jgi:predicted TPR repeat methyltransferase
MTYIERIVNADTNEVIEKPYTKEQVAEVDAAKKKWQEMQATEAAKAAEKAAATAKLAALGLTEDDLKALGLGNN